MNQLLTELKNKCSVDVDDTLNRFADAEKLYVKFLFRFVKDENFQKLKTQAETDTYDENSIYYAHSFKGVSGNLGMTLLFEKFKEIESDINDNNFSAVNAKIQSVNDNYNLIIDTIKQFS
ncbi:MAG: hypothetical protein LBL93_06120 [Ruminococcus sp.]|jgi:HPt (histidine-containing phosphotransfer) domain-containing protein|nr:hypothetical protein [Ruminococcus sp.]